MTTKPVQWPFPTADQIKPVDAQKIRAELEQVQRKEQRRQQREDKQDVLNNCEDALL